jgi:MFS family permease
VQARLDGRVQRRHLIIAGLACVAAGITLTAIALTDAVPLATVVLAWAIGGLGMGLGYSSISLFVLARAQPGREGQDASSMKLMEVLGGALGAGGGGVIVGMGGDAWRAEGLAITFAITAVAALIGIIAASRMGRDRVNETGSAATERNAA